jgi:hypothetical protein
MMWIWLLLSALLGVAMAQSITAVNWTAADVDQVKNNTVDMTISMRSAMVPMAGVLPLTGQAGNNIPVSSTVVVHVSQPC